jgi:hypothetical protein
MALPKSNCCRIETKDESRGKLLKAMNSIFFVEEFGIAHFLDDFGKI